MAKLSQFFKNRRAGNAGQQAAQQAGQAATNAQQTATAAGQQAVDNVIKQKGKLKKFVFTTAALTTAQITLYQLGKLAGKGKETEKEYHQGGQAISKML